MFENLKHHCFLGGWAFQGNFPRLASPEENFFSYCLLSMKNKSEMTLVCVFLPKVVGAALLSVCTQCTSLIPFFECAKGSHKFVPNPPNRAAESSASLGQICQKFAS